MPWLMKLFLPTAVKVLEKYVLSFISDRFPQEAQLAQEVIDFINAHFMGQPTPSENLSSAAEHFSSLERAISVP